MMKRDSWHFLFLNIGHFLDHYFLLIFATAAALVLAREWGLSYGILIAYATPGFFAFGLFSYPAGWLADKWSRRGMICVFYFGIGIFSIFAGFANTPFQIGSAQLLVGFFAAIYHPVGLAMVTQRWRNTGMRIAINGVWGNLGVASAALVTGYFIDNVGWRAAFIVPGFVSILVGIGYAVLCWTDPAEDGGHSPVLVPSFGAAAPDHRAMIWRVSVIVFFVTALSSVVFQATTFALPKIFDERIKGVVTDMAGYLNSFGVAGTINVASIVGAFAFVVFVVASFAQLVVGCLLDRFGPRSVFIGAAAVQVMFFGLMAGLRDVWALAVALGFMLGAFGQIPITDYMIAKLASGPARARVYGVRYVVSFSALAASLPLIAFVYEQWGFDTLFRLLSAAALIILLAVLCLPRRLPATN